MRKLILPLILSLFAFMACEKVELTTDADIVEAIQQSTKKHAIQADALPGQAMGFIQEGYSGHTILKSWLVSNAGFDVRLTRQAEGVQVRTQLFFDLNGRHLRSIVRENKVERNQESRDRHHNGCGNDRDTSRG